MYSRLPYWLLERPPHPLLATASEIKLHLLRLVDDDGTPEQIVSYSIHGELSIDDDGDLVAALLSQFRCPRPEGGAA